MIMPRGVRGPKKTFDQQIEELDAKIASYQQQIADVKDAKKKLLQEKEEAQIVEIKNILNESGMTTDELAALIAKGK